MNEIFRKIAHNISYVVGTPWAFFFAIIIIIIWLVTGPIFNYSDTWQLIINTGTTIITFLMVFVIQNTQNREAKAVQLKLDELIRAVRGARKQMVDLENLDDNELEKVAEEFHSLHERAGSIRVIRSEKK